MQLATMQQAGNSARRGSSLERPVRYGQGSCERSLSVGVYYREPPALMTRGQGASSSSALPTLASIEAAGPVLGTAADASALQASSRRLGSGSPPRGNGDCNLPQAMLNMHSGRNYSGRKASGTKLGGVGAAGASGGSEPEAEPPGSSAAALTTVAAAMLAARVAEAVQENVVAENPVSRADDNFEDNLGANVEVSEEGGLELNVRLMPSELIRWDEIQILQPISTGSFGEVFLARYNCQEVSVKRCIIGTDGSMTKEQLHNLEREINTYRMLDHPSIVKYIGCVLEHPNLAIVTEYVPNGNVFDLLYMRRVNLPAAIRLKIASQVALAICYMHSCDPIVIHRDLKTQNLVLDAEYSVRLCDFGKTQAMEDDASLPIQQDNGGSPRYMAPECFQQGCYITEKVDIWSLGCCLVEVFGGPLPYEDTPQMAQVVNLMLRHRQPPLVPPWFTPEVRPMLSQCFEFDPAVRIAISEVQLALKRLTPEELERHGMDKRRTH